MIPYGHQIIEDDDIAAVSEALRSDWLTQGPRIAQFEEALAKYAGARFAVVASNGTAALHAAYYAAGLGEGDEFITSPMTFVSTATAGMWMGGKPVLVDIDPSTGNIDPELIEAKISPKTKVIVPIDYTGRPADLNAIRDIARKHKLIIIEDACQAFGASYHGKKIGSVSDMTALSFHPVKSITTGEGGAVLTDNEEFYRKMKAFVSHGIVKDHLINVSHGDWYFEMQDQGLNYRLTDFQCALGMNQLKKLDRFIAARKKIADYYLDQLRGIDGLLLPSADTPISTSAWHLFVIRMQGVTPARKAEIFKEFRSSGIGVQVHHIPIYLHPYYQNRGYAAYDFPKTDAWYISSLSLPIYPNLSQSDQDRVIEVCARSMKKA